MQGKGCFGPNSSGQHLLSLINDVLDLSKVEAGKMSLELECIEAEPLLAGALSVVKENAANHRIALKLDTAPDQARLHGRVVGKVFVEGNDICMRQIEAGLAWIFKKYKDEQPAPDRPRYKSAESTARAAQVGLWRDPYPIPPWEFRKAQAGNRKISR